MARIVYTRPDGGLSYIVPVEHSVEEVLAKDVPSDATDVHVVDDSAIPRDFTFHDAWRNDNGRIVVDMLKARNILRDQIRAARVPILQALDIEYQIADERGDDKAKRSIAARKQALRDAPADPTIDMAATTDALEALWPPSE